MSAISRALHEGDVEHLIQLPGVYDGWSILVRRSDGAPFNRWEDPDNPGNPITGLERRFSATERAIHHPPTDKEDTP